MQRPPSPALCSPASCKSLIVLGPVLTAVNLHKGGVIGPSQGRNRTSSHSRRGKTAKLSFSHALPAHRASNCAMQGHCPSSGKGIKAYVGSRPLLALVVLVWFCMRHFQCQQSYAIDDSSTDWLEPCFCNLQATLKLDFHEL